MTEIATLIRQRGTFKAGITKISNWFDTNGDSESDYLNLEFRFEKLAKLVDDYENVQISIGSIDNDAIENSDIEDKYINCLSRLKRKIIHLKSVETVSQLPPLTPSSVPSTHVNLPLLNVPEFRGEITQWNSFFQLYETLILQNHALNDVQKLIYLKSYLREEPLRLIDTLPLTNGNLVVAVETLKQRYDNQLLIIFSHIKNLIEVPSINKLTSHSLREFVVKIKQNLESLKNQNIPVDQWDLMLIYVLSQKLDYGTRRAYISERGTQVNNSNPGSLPKLADFLCFLEKRCCVLEDINELPATKQAPTFSNSLSSRSGTQNRPRTFVHLAHGGRNNHSNGSTPCETKSNSCIFCDRNGHKIYTCSHYINSSHDDKIKFVKASKLCFNCLGMKHVAEACTSSRCRQCGGSHHTSLHKGSPSSPTRPAMNWRNASSPPPLTSSNSNQPVQPSLSAPTNVNQQNCVTQTTLSAFSPRDNEVLLATAIVNVIDSNNVLQPARVLLDPGSTISIVTSDLVDRLNSHVKSQTIAISGIGGQVCKSTKSVEIQIRSRVDPTFSANTNCCVLPKITEISPHFRIDRRKMLVPPNVILADPTFHEPSPIDILLGADMYYRILSGGTQTVNNHALTLINTHLGTVISGLVPQGSISSAPSCSLSTQGCFLLQGSAGVESPINALVEKFWKLEEVSCKEELSLEDRMVEENFKRFTIRLSNGAFQVNLPLKSPQENLKLGDSFNLAHKRFLNLEKRFRSNPSVFEEYKSFIHEYLALGHGRVVPLSMFNDIGERKYFLPHHCVIREDHKTTKLRVVFDGAMKTSSGHSINDILLKGYTVQPDLYDILLRFRLFKFVFTSDIQKMYRQVKINPTQTHLQNILWRDHPSKELQCIELLTVTYGMKPSTFLATRALREVARTHETEFPLASRAIELNCYVDDILVGRNSESELSHLQSQLISLLKLGGFELHKWCSNSLKFMSDAKALPANVLQNQYFFESDVISNKVLGLFWNPNLDVFSISLPKYHSYSSLTKREALSNIAQMYDPLGLVGPIIVVFKIFMQKIWKLQINWDDKLSESMLNEWNDNFKQFSLLETLKIPRYIFSDSNAISIEIHGFSDASCVAYGACVYIRTLCANNKASVRLVTAKSRVCPLKQLTIPRLELCGALLLSELITRVIAIFNTDVNLNSVHLWSDSQIVLAWIKADPTRFNVFVSNRIAQIQTLTSLCQWHYVPTKCNPADYLSRGLTASQLLASKTWWEGPEFLQNPHYNPDEFNIPLVPASVELKRIHQTLVASSHNDLSSTFENFSSFTKLTRTMAYVRRFINNCKPPFPKLTGALSLNELKGSEHDIVRIVQTKHLFSLAHSLKLGNLKDKQWLKLSPYIDKVGIIRVGGRLSQAPIEFDNKHPILLPSKNHTVNLLLLKEHIRFGHSGAQTTLSNIRQRYWPLNGLKELKKICINCIPCFKLKAKVSQQIMADLPQSRVTPSRPFSNVGVDFGGPFLVKVANLKHARYEKAYISLFVCMATKAVHLDVVSNLSTEAFLACFKRFISRRGCPVTVFSDNGTNFHGACNQLKDLYKFFKSPKCKEAVSKLFMSNEICWKFTPPYSPHWGGLWEASIKSTKYHLKRLIGTNGFTFEEFYTILCQIEAILNSRPLSPLSADPSDFTCLTPGHFLIGCPLVSYPEPDVSDVNMNRLKRWQRITQVQQLFWSRWRKDYLNQLQCKPKWLSPVNPINVNDVVLLKEDNTKPLNWPLARVLELLPGKDGRTRLVKLRTPFGEVMRNVGRVCPLPSNN